MTALLPATLLLALSADPAQKIAFIDLDTPMMGMASQVSQALKDAAAQQKLSVFPTEEVRTRLGLKKYNELVKCAGKPSCVSVAMADFTELTRVVAGSLAVDEKNYRLRLALIDLKSGEVVADVDRTILIASRRFQKDVKELAGPLLRGEREARGTLVVTANAPNARVSVNGELVGTAPLTVQLKPGKHEVKVERPKFLPVTRLVDLEANQTFNADIRMILKPGEKLEEDVPALVARSTEPADSGAQGFRVRPATIVAGAATVLSFGIGTVFGIQSSSTDKQLLAGYNPNTNTFAGKRIEALAARQNAYIANGCFIVGGAALITTAVLLVLDVRAGSSAPVQVTPVAAPDGAGVSVGGTF